MRRFKLQTVGKLSAYLTGSAAKPYAVGAAAGLLARALSLAAGFGNLWLLTQMLTKEQFAGYVVVFALVTWLALAGTAGLDRTILYRLSRVEAAPGELMGGPLVAAALIAVLPVSAGFAGIVALGASLGYVGHLPDLALWSAALAPMVVTTCLGRIFESWYWARGRITPSVLIPATGELARTVCLAVAFFILPTVGGVAVAVITAAFVPLFLWSAIAPLGKLRRPIRMERHDVSYGLKAMLAKATYLGIHQIDVLMIGILATATATADYAVAARLALMVALIKGLLAPVLTPRLGRYSATGNREALLHEYDQVRLFGLVAALACAALFAAFGRPILAAFGDYQQSYCLLMILAAGYVVNAGFGSNAAFLTIDGHAGWTLAARFTLLAAIAMLNLVLIPAMSAMGAALSMALGMVAVNILLCYLIWRLDRLPTISPGLVVLLSVAYSLLLLVGFDAIGSLVAALGLGALVGVLLLVQSQLWLPTAKQLFTEGRRTGTSEESVETVR